LLVIHLINELAPFILALRLEVVGSLMYVHEFRGELFRKG